MLTRLDIQNAKQTVLALPLSDTSGGYLVKDVQGLDPVPATLVSSSMAQVDGAQFQTSRRDPRNITMKLGLLPNYANGQTVGDLRSNLHNIVMPKTSVTLSLYKNGILVATTTGVVESFQMNMFSADPEVDLSIICYDPDLYAPGQSTVNGNTTATGANTPINYWGNSDTGVIFTMNVNRSISGFSLINARPDFTQTFNVVASLIAGDVVTINSIPGQRAITLTRGGIPISSANFIGNPATWISLTGGINNFRASLAGAVIPYTLTYPTKYGGF